MYVDNGELKFKHNLIKRTKGVTSIFLSFVLLISLVLTSNTAIEVFAAPVDPAYSVTITLGANQSADDSGNLSQSINDSDNEINPVIITASANYHFEAFADISSNGITAHLEDDGTVRVSGTPTDSATVVIPDAVADTPAHSHSWTYAGSGATITATCTGEGDCTYKSNPVSLTLSATGGTYTGSGIGASFATEDVNAWETAGLVVPTITYTGTDYNSTTRPTDAGTYTASVTVGGQSASKEFTVSKATLTSVSVNQTVTLTYNENAQTPTVSASATAVNSQEVTFTYSLTNGSGYGAMPSFTNVSDCGIVYYKTSAPNHNDATGEFTVTMDKADQATPSAPTLNTASLTSITLNEIENGLYRRGSEEWQTEPTFSGLSMNTSYTFYQKKAGDANHNESSASEGASFSTNNHVHEYVYSQSDATITETCQNSDTGHTGAVSSTITIVAPTLTTFGGAGSAEATVTGSLSGIATPTINYKEGETSLGTTAPTNPGTYTAYITLTGVELSAGGTGDVTASVEYTIANAGITPTVSLEGWTYGESANTPSVTGNPGSGAVTYEYFTNAGCTDKTTEADGASGEGLVPSFAGTYYVKASVAAAGGYGAGSGSASFTISKKALTITASDQSITYGQSISEETTDASVTGLVTGDSLFGIDIAQSTVNATDAGTVTPSNAVIKKGEVNVTSNYDITYNTGTLTISKVSVTIKAKNQTVELNGSISTDVSKAEVSEGTLVTGDELISVTLESSSTASVTTSGTITASAAVIKNNNGTGSDVTANYNITYAEGVLTVSQALPTVTAPTAKSNLKYTGNPIELINAGSTTGGTLLYSLNGTTYNEDVSTITGEDAGTYTVYYKVDGGENYGSTEPESFTVTIGKMDAPASVASANSPTAVANLEYTGGGQALVTAPSSLPTGYAAVKYRLSDSAEWSETIPAGTAVSSYTVQVKYFGDSNHEDFVGENIAVSIGAKDLSTGVSVSQSATSFEVGSTPCVPTVTVTKTAGSTVLASGTDYDVEYIGVSPTTYAQNAAAPTSAGTYKVVIVFKGNYTGSFTVADSFSITRPAATITPHNLSTVYDGSPYDVSALFTFPDGVGTKTYSIVESASTGEGSITGSNLTITKAGSIKISVTTAASESVDSLTASATLVVNKGVATGTISVADVTYGTALSNPTVTVNPVGAGSGTVEYKKDGTTTWSATKPIAAGDYTARVIVGGNDLYDAATETTTFTINRASLAVTPTSGLTKVYGQTDPAITLEVSGLKYEDTREQVLSGAPSRLPGEDAGSYLIIVGNLQVVGTNYTLNYTPGTFTVTKATHDNVTVSAANALLVPEVSTSGLTFDVRNYIIPAPAATAVYTVASTDSTLVTSATVTGSVVTYVVSAGADGDTGSVVVTVADPNYENYTVTVPVKVSGSINYIAEADSSGSTVVSAATSQNLTELAQGFAQGQGAAEAKLEIADASAPNSETQSTIFSAASGMFVGFEASEVSKAYLDIDIKKIVAGTLGTLGSGTETDVSDVGKSIEIVLNVGTAVTGKNPVVVRTHDGTTRLFTQLGQRATGNYPEGAYYVDTTNGLIYVYSRYFSLYSILYSNGSAQTVTFDTAGGSYVPSVSVKSGSALTRPSNPSKSGYSFGGWMFAGTAYDFSTPVSSDITLIARWNAASSSSSSSDSDHSSHSDKSEKKQETTNPTPQPTNPAPKAKITKVPEKLVTAKIDKKNTKKQNTKDTKKETIKDTKKDDTKKETAIPTVGASTDSDKIDEAYDRSVSTDKAVTAIAMAVCIAAIAFVAWLLFMLKHSKESVA